ncbi:MAG: hypothetical protein ACI9U2_001080 [Bradymonadia bacterium]
MLLAMFSACGQSSGCSGCESEGDPFPDKDRIHSAIQVRLAEDGIAFLEENLEPVLDEVLPDGLAICIPGQGGDIIGLVQWGFCADMCDDGSQGCQANIALGGIDLEPVEPGTLRATIVFDQLAFDIPVFANPIVDCTISIDAPGFPVQVDVDLTTPDPTRDLTFSIMDPVFRLADLNLRLQGNGGFLSPLCDLIDGVINFPIIGDLIFDLLQGFIEGPLADLLSGFIDDFTCRTCEDAGDCPIEGGVQCVDGQCQLDGQCIPAPLGIEGLLSLSDLAGDFYSVGTTPDIGYLITPGSYVDVENGGLSLGIIGGATSERDRCVPVRAQPLTDEPPRAALLRGNLDPAGRSFEVGFGITGLFLEHAMWATFNGGGLCIAIAGGQIEQLNAGTLGVALPGLRALTRDPNTAIAVTLSPQEIPTFRIGANTTRADPDNEGQFVLDDPLLTLEISDLWIDFHAFMEGRWTRIFSLRADVVVPIGLAFAPDNGIIPIIGDLGGALQNIETANGEIMTDDPQRLAALLPVLIGPLLNGALEGLSEPIVVPDIIGYQLSLQENSIAGIEENSMIGLFANLERAPAEGEGYRAAVQTTAEVVERHIPPTARFELDGDDTWKRPWVRLVVDAFAGEVDDPEMEFSWKVDGMSWSLFTPASSLGNGTVIVRSPAFLLQGKHQIQVRARRVDDYKTLDPTPAVVEVIIDSIAPNVALHQADGKVDFEIDDMVSAAEDLTVEVRIDQGAWALTTARSVDVEAGQRVEVRVTDEAGNAQTTGLQTREDALIGRRPPQADNMGGGGCGDCGGGCRVAQSSNSELWWIAVPIGLLGLRRRRRWMLVALAAGLIVSGCDDETPKRDGDDDAGMRDALPPDCVEDIDCADPNLVCQDGDCVAQGCTEAADCAGMDCEGRDATCNAAGICECEPFCAGGCGDGDFCCFARNACESIPDGMCDGVDTCPPGYDRVLLQDGVVNPETCQAEGAQCECVERSAIELGLVGRHSDLVVVDGVAVLSGYAEKFGDLVVGKFDDIDGVQWRFVDGVPEGGEVVGAPSGPRGGVEDAGPNVGTWTSMAAGPDGSLHVAYYDVDNQALKYAHGAPANAGWTWRTVTLDDTGNAGQFNSISVGPNGVPGIGYRVGSVVEGAQFFSELRYRLAKNDAPGAGVDWNPAFVVQRREIAAEDPTTGDYPEGTGLFTSQTRGNDGLPIVAWYDRTLGALWVARFEEVGFGEPEMLAGWGHPNEELDGDMGTNVDIAVDDQGELHLCFQDGRTDSLRYLVPGLGVNAVVDDGTRVNEGRGYAVHVVGEDCNMRLTADGAPVIVYQDSTGHDLLVARGDGMGGWIRRALRGQEAMYRGAFGFYTRARLDGDMLWISNWVYANEEAPATQRLEVYAEEL